MPDVWGEDDMSDHPKQPHAEMLNLATALTHELAPYVDRIAIAGSIRRGAPECADIEIVAIPRMGTARQPGELLPRHVDLLDHYAREHLDTGRWQPRRDKNGRAALGDRYKRLLVDGVPLDLFSVLPPASFAVILLIRTGPAEFGRAMVTQRSKGGRLPDGYRVQDGAIRTVTGPVEIADEAAWFNLCGMDYVPPEERHG